MVNSNYSKKKDEDINDWYLILESPFLGAYPLVHKTFVENSYFRIRR